MPQGPPPQAMDGGGFAHRGRSDEAAPLKTPKLLWKVETGGVIVGGASPAESVVYFGSHDKQLYAVADDGTVKWKFAARDLIFSTPAVAADGTVYFGSDDDRLYALAPDGSKKWETKI